MALGATCQINLVTLYYMWHGTHAWGGVAGSKLTWTWAYVTPPCHMVPLDQPILFYIDGH